MRQERLQPSRLPGLTYPPVGSLLFLWSRRIGADSNSHSLFLPPPCDRCCDGFVSLARIISESGGQWREVMTVLRAKNPHEGLYVAPDEEHQNVADLFLCQARKKADLEARLSALAELQRRLHEENQEASRDLDEGRKEVAAVEEKLGQLEHLRVELSKQFETILQSRRDGLAELQAQKDKLSADLHDAMETIQKQLDVQGREGCEGQSRGEELREALRAELEGLDEEAQVSGTCLSDLLSTLRLLVDEYTKLEGLTEVERAEQKNLVEEAGKVKSEEEDLVKEMGECVGQLDEITSKTAAHNGELMRLQGSMEEKDKQIWELDREKKVLSQKYDKSVKAGLDIQEKLKAMVQEAEVAEAKTKKLQELRKMLSQELDKSCADENIA